MGSVDGGGDCQRDGAVLGINVGHPIVTNGDFVTSNGDFVTYLFSAIGGGDTALPKLLWDFLLLLAHCALSI